MQNVVSPYLLCNVTREKDTSVPCLSKNQNIWNSIYASNKKWGTYSSLKQDNESVQ